MQDEDCSSSDPEWDADMSEGSPRSGPTNCEDDGKDVSTSSERLETEENGVHMKMPISTMGYDMLKRKKKNTELRRRATFVPGLLSHGGGVYFVSVTAQNTPEGPLNHVLTLTRIPRTG